MKITFVMSIFMCVSLIWTHKIYSWDYFNCMLDPAEAPYGKLEPIHLRMPVPGPLFAFGQNLLGEKVYMNEAINYYGDGTQLSEYRLNCNFIWSMKKNLSFLVSIPARVRRFRLDDGTPINGTGLTDLATQIEYAFYLKRDFNLKVKSSIVLAAFMPTGSKDFFSLGTYKKVSFFSGITFRIFTDKIYTFMSTGMHWGRTATFTSPNPFGITIPNFRIGNFYFYELGFGLWLFENDQFYFRLMVEFSGLYEQRDRVRNPNNPILQDLALFIKQNSGSNLFFGGPVIQIGLFNAVIHLGILFPMIQKIFSLDRKFDTLIGAGVSLWHKFI